MHSEASKELLAKVVEGDEQAATALFDRYAVRLIGLARSRLSMRLASRVDPEDVVQSACRSFFMRARDGEFKVEQPGDLWRLLARITVRKACRNARRHGAGKRNASLEEPLDFNGEARPILSREPTPEQAAILTEELERLLAPLKPHERRIVELRLDGDGIDEIAAQVGRSGRTVRRTLASLGEELRWRLKGDETRKPSELPPDAKLVRYGDIVLKRQIGAGGFGRVYRAIWKPHGVEAAVKILRKRLWNRAAANERFLKEAAVLAKLRHPGIVSLYGVGVLPKRGHFLLMELVDGEDLSRRMTQGRIAVKDALRWTAEAAEAVDHAHRQGIVHCDLKPSNLLLDRNGRVRVADFGFARMLDDPAAGVGGTRGFIAPEQLDPSIGAVTPRTDVYGLGAVLFALLSGRLPFHSSSEAVPVGEHAAEWPECADVPNSVIDLCRRCLTQDPMARPASAAELASELQSLQGCAILGQ
jgi:RNA polymerase sigma factor (sigma-70 family)